jgi:two-component system, chemotaxis family, chemotaxis protein CheY
MRILIVDDDYVSRAKLSTILSEYGQCDNAPSGEIAVKLFEAAHQEMVPYDLVTMDIEMPGMNGQEAVDAIRKLEQGLLSSDMKPAAILMVTGRAAPEEVSSSYYRGCNGYLTKPISPEKIKRYQVPGAQPGTFYFRGQAA